MKYFHFIAAPSSSGRTQRRLCFEKYFSEDASEEEIRKWEEKLQSFATPYHYHSTAIEGLSKSFEAVECGYLCGEGNFTVYKFADYPQLYIDIWGVWNESFALKDPDACFETHEKSGRYYQVFTALENVLWLNVGTIRRPKYLYSHQIVKNINKEEKNEN